MKQRDTVASALLALVAAAALLTACKSGSDHEKAEPAEAAAIFDAEDRLGLRDAPLQGKDDAVVTIVEFSSYQCPFCGRVQPTLEQLRKDFPNDVRFSFKQHPLPSQANSRPAARAALAAHAQGKFWEYSALQFANQGSLIYYFRKSWCCTTISRGIMRRLAGVVGCWHHASHAAQRSVIGRAG